ncbi:maleylpyruvate isomerase family mycothiol-dependent enzyme [Nakamurella leprariae]|uniref:Maleylpyruvate isomerase family mycothiol-dependent enzyme n=1 Tax=Nakamurella leprariae TaxID=2803911 RepID=A0A938YKG6_9ACTN|nr:maleylpyruvate isomerase family mycothiol-dependent enzyme [Nakamurella leprariae]MBM9469430.1 maleylpyruvate isomerase family mycothiol-dependent enzyme [Nakamurella leprariae]
MSRSTQARGTTVAAPAATVGPDRARIALLASTEYRRTIAAWRSLEPADWSRPTPCPGWTVQQMVAHTVGMTEMTTSIVQLAGQNIAAARAGGGIDALTAVQVRRHAGQRPDELIAAMIRAAPRALRGRRTLSRTLGRAPLPERQEVGDDHEWWRIGYLVDTILTRDPWMHRMDLAATTGRPPELTAEHDGAIVAGVVDEWARRHGRPYRLRLTGPAGGSWSTADGGDELELDAVEFCRVLSGRGSEKGLLAQRVPF